MKNIEKIILALLMIYSSSLSAIVLEPNTVKNTTDMPVTIVVTRQCLEQPSKTSTDSTTIQAGQTGKLDIMGSSMVTCTSHPTKIKATASGVLPATIRNPIAKDYTVSLRIPPIPPYKNFPTPSSYLILEQIFGGKNEM